MVDDDRAIANLLGAFLERLGLAVTVAYDPAEGRLRLGDGGWSLVITDLQLGAGADSEGLELIGEARSRCPQARVILISGTAGPEIETDARRRGADLFLPKPVSFATLERSLGALLA